MVRPFLALNAFRGKQHNPQFDPPIYFIILFWCILRNYLRLNSPPAVYSFIEDIFFLSWPNWRYKSSHKTATINFFFKVTIDISEYMHILIIELNKQGQKKFNNGQSIFVHCLIFTQIACDVQGQLCKLYYFYNNKKNLRSIYLQTLWKLKKKF